MPENFEAYVRKLARELPYPPPPAPQPRPVRRLPTPVLRTAATLVLLLGMASLALPPVRATVAEWLQLGAVTVYLTGVDADGEPLRLDDVAGETTLQTALAQVDFSVRLPADDPPDRVFLQDGSLLVAVWLAGNQIERTLYQTRSDLWRFYKGAASVEQTQVAGANAFWFEVAHPVQFGPSDTPTEWWTSFVAGRVLVWERENITYRLETRDDLEAARVFAESLVVVP